MKGITFKLATFIMLLGLFGIYTNPLVEAAQPEVVTVQFNDLTPQQKEQIQKGEPNYEALDGERVILVYDYNKEVCQLPKTGTDSTMIKVNKVATNNLDIFFKLCIPPFFLIAHYCTVSIF